jgi:hypothetical protein
MVLHLDLHSMFRARFLRERMMSFLDDLRFANEVSLRA